MRACCVCGSLEWAFCFPGSEVPPEPMVAWCAECWPVLKQVPAPPDLVEPS